MHQKHKYSVSINGKYLGDVYAVSEAHAINCVRYRKNLLFEPFDRFRARLIV